MSHVSADLDLTESTRAREPGFSPSLCTRRGFSLVSLSTWVAAVCAIGAAGIPERTWFVFYRPVSSDEAIVGLMARAVSPRAPAQRRRGCAAHAHAEPGAVSRSRWKSAVFACSFLLR